VLGNFAKAGEIQDALRRRMLGAIGKPRLGLARLLAGSDISVTRHICYQGICVHRFAIASVSAVRFMSSGRLQEELHRQHRWDSAAGSSACPMSASRPCSTR
jgi:hypothetical protein